MQHGHCTGRGLEYGTQHSGRGLGQGTRQSTRAGDWDMVASRARGLIRQQPGPGTGTQHAAGQGDWDAVASRSGGEGYSCQHGEVFDARIVYCQKGYKTKGENEMLGKWQCDVSTPQY